MAHRTCKLAMAEFSGMSWDQQGEALGRDVMESQDSKQWHDNGGPKESQQRGREHTAHRRSQKEEEGYLIVQGGEGVGIG